MRRFRNSQIVTITNFVVESSVGGTRVDCIKDCITVRALDKKKTTNKTTKKLETKLYETKINGYVGFKLNLTTPEFLKWTLPFFDFRLVHFCKEVS